MGAAEPVRREEDKAGRGESEVQPTLLVRDFAYKENQKRVVITLRVLFVSFLINSLISLVILGKFLFLPVPYWVLSVIIGINVFFGVALTCYSSGEARHIIQARNIFLVTFFVTILVSFMAGLCL